MGDQAGSRGGATRILGSGKIQSAVDTEESKTQSKQNENTSLMEKVPSHVANTDKNYGLL